MKGSIDVYWAPAASSMDEYNWNSLYSDLTSVYSDLLKNKNNDLNNMGNDLFRCPSFRNLTSNTFFLKIPLNTDISFLENSVKYNSNSGINIAMIRDEESINKRKSIIFNLGIILFSQESLEISVTPPYLHNTASSNYAVSSAGSMNIGSFFRPIMLEYMLWENQNKIVLKENEPAFYITFHTNKKINLKRFTMSQELERIAKTCSNAGYWDRGKTLIEKYLRFTNTKTNEIVLREIRKNLV